MEQDYIREKTFEKNNFTIDPLARGEYENCIFSSCDFSNSDLTDIKFFECEFLACNLSMATLKKTTFKDVKFKDCKMLGLLFEHCNEYGFTVSFDNCILNYSSFYQKKIKKTSFKNSELHEVEFSDCDLTGSVFSKCDLMSAKFENTIIEKVDFRTSFNYSIDPDFNRIKKAKFSLTEIAGLLNKYDIEIDKTC